MEEVVAIKPQRRRKGIRRNHPLAGIDMLAGMAGRSNFGSYQVPADILFHNDTGLQFITKVEDHGQNFAGFQKRDFVVFSIHS